MSICSASNALVSSRSSCRARVSLAVAAHLQAGVDYRTTGEQLTEFYLTPLNQATQDRLAHAWNRLSAGAVAGPQELTVFGRQVKIEKAAGHMAWFGFHDLCAQALSAADYQAIAKNFHTVFVTSIPRLNLGLKAEVKRLILLVDELYEHKVKLFTTAAAAPADLLSLAEGEAGLDDPEGAGSALFSGAEERFAFARAVSRLQEMQTREYLELDHVELGRPGYVDDVLAVS